MYVRDHIEGTGEAITNFSLKRSTAVSFRYDLQGGFRCVANGLPHEIVGDHRGYRCNNQDILSVFMTWGYAFRKKFSDTLPCWHSGDLIEFVEVSVDHHTLCLSQFSGHPHTELRYPVPRGLQAEQMREMLNGHCITHTKSLLITDPRGVEKAG